MPSASNRIWDYFAFLKVKITARTVVARITTKKLQSNVRITEAGYVFQCWRPGLELHSSQLSVTDAYDVSAVWRAHPWRHWAVSATESLVLFAAAAIQLLRWQTPFHATWTYIPVYKPFVMVGWTSSQNCYDARERANKKIINQRKYIKIYK